MPAVGGVRRGCDYRSKWNKQARHCAEERVESLGGWVQDDNARGTEMFAKLTWGQIMSIAPLPDVVAVTALAALQPSPKN